jgi:hypothetical protein
MDSRLPQRVLFLIAWTTFTFWTIRRFWWPTNDAALAKLYTQCQVLGPIMTVCFALLFSLQMDLPALSFWATSAFSAVIAFPFVMWGVFFTLRSIHAILARF